MFHVKHPLAWKILTVIGSVAWGVVVVSMFCSIAIAVFHGFNPSGFPQYIP